MNQSMNQSDELRCPVCGLVPLDEKEVRRQLAMAYCDPENKGKDLDANLIMGMAKSLCARFGTPYLAKTQLLALLPEKKEIPKFSTTELLMALRDDSINSQTRISDYNNGYNAAIDEMRKRIEWV